MEGTAKLGAAALCVLCVLSAAVGVDAGADVRRDVRVRGVNQFGDRTEDSLYTAKALVEALRAAEGNGTRSMRARRSARNRVGEIVASVRLEEPLKFQGDPRTTRTCRMCYVLANSLITRIREDGVTGEELIDLATDLCILANIQAEPVCRGLVGFNTPTIEYVVRNTPKLDGPFACGTIIPECHDGAPGVDWRLDVDMGKKPKTVGHTLIGEIDPPPKPKPFRILQMTDFHWDSMYAPGGNAKCGLPTCCRHEQGSAPSEEDQAGRWGDYRRCDVPWETVLEFFRYANENQEQFDLVYFTGDIVDHGVWLTSKESNKELIRKTYKKMKEAFGNVTILPLLGNHEPHPLNVFAPDYIRDEKLSTRWLYETLADVWTMWLPPDTRDTILRGGFYTVLVKPGLRVVALNNMFCYAYNWWLMHDPVDPSGQLAWLVEVLLAAEEAGERVHILSHIPSGSYDCLEVWGNEYARIVDRFSDTIAAQFNGHTHFDQLTIFFGEEDDRPNNVAFNGGSLTSYADVNPNFKIYLVDGNHEDATWSVLDAELWGFNLTAANLLPVGQRPHWYRMYSFKEVYGVESMHPMHIYMLFERMAEDPQLQQLYYRYRMLESDPGLARGCDNVCVETILCEAVTSVTNHKKHCDKLLKKKRLMHQANEKL